MSSLSCSCSSSMYAELSEASRGDGKTQTVLHSPGVQ